MRRPRAAPPPACSALCETMCAMRHSVGRREFLAGTFAAPLIHVLHAAVAKPNVLILMTDQESAMTQGPVRRPGRESLEKRGVRFTQAFCNTPQRSPARSS